MAVPARDYRCVTIPNGDTKGPDVGLFNLFKQREFPYSDSIREYISCFLDKVDQNELEVARMIILANPPLGMRRVIVLNKHTDATIDDDTCVHNNLSTDTIGLHPKYHVIQWLEDMDNLPSADDADALEWTVLVFVHDYVVRGRSFKALVLIPVLLYLSMHETWMAHGEAQRAQLSNLAFRSDSRHFKAGVRYVDHLREKSKKTESVKPVSVGIHPRLIKPFKA